LFLYLAFCVAIRSHRIAGIAVLIYFSAPALTSFNSMFVYETLALTFMGFCMLAALRSAIEKSAHDRRRWFIIAVLCIFSTVITHHITSYMLTGFLILVAIASRITGSRNTAARFGILAAISLLSVLLWICTVARFTFSYFAPTVTGIVQGIEALSKNGTSTAPSASSGPFNDTLLGAGALLAITVLIGLGCWQAWRRHRRHPWIIGMMLGCLGWFVDLGVRLGTPDGQELAGRAATFVYIPVSVLGALALTRVVNSGPVRRWGAAVTAVIVAAVVTLLIDGLANGWPPYWERLPAPGLKLREFGRPGRDRHLELDAAVPRQRQPDRRRRRHLPGPPRLRRPERAPGDLLAVRQPHVDQENAGNGVRAGRAVRGDGHQAEPVAAAGRNVLPGRQHGCHQDDPAGQPDHVQQHQRRVPGVRRREHQHLLPQEPGLHSGTAVQAACQAR
jgi:hypothetical protein